MPYIKQSQRDQLHERSRGAWTAGELNYMFTHHILGFIRANGGLNYENVNAVVGALECCKLELYRRLAAPYEDRKIAENGDVYHD